MKIKFILIYLFTVILSVSSFAGNSINVPEKILNSFQNFFPEVKNETSYLSNGTYEAYFKSENNMACRLYYSHEGKLLYTLKYYPGKSLPLFLRMALAEKYIGKNIFSVTELCTRKSINYYIIIDDDRNLYEIEVHDGEIHLDKTYKKR